MADNALKPCPFCGYDLVLVHETDWSDPPTWSVHCVNKDCPLHGAKLTRADAVAAWNARTPAPTPASDQVERVARALCWHDYDGDPDMLPLVNDNWRHWSDAARAAIAAIRDTKGE